MIVEISKENFNKMLQQAKDEFPIECCGLLAGNKVENRLIINEIYPLKNIDESSEHFTMDPKEQFEVIKLIRKQGNVLIGNYHSHPYTPSRPSEEDKRLAYDPEMLYGILSLKEEKPVLNFFKIDKETVEKLDFKLI